MFNIGHNGTVRTVARVARRYVKVGILKPVLPCKNKAEKIIIYLPVLQFYNQPPNSVVDSHD